MSNDGTYGGVIISDWDPNKTACFLQKDGTMGTAYWEDYSKGGLGSRLNPVTIMIEQ